MYGDWQTKGTLYTQLKAAVSRKDRVFNMSSGEQLLDYLPVSEVGRLIVKLAELRCDVGTVNVCAGKPISLRKLVEGWIRKNCWEIELNLGHYPYRDYEPVAFWGDRSRLDGVIR
jgi:dTDP-6-deoxy-L-talose 4-dehydrogenase (NAD+)